MALRLHDEPRKGWQGEEAVTSKGGEVVPVISPGRGMLKELEEAM